MQVQPIKPMLKAPGTKRLKLKYDETPSNVAFKFDLRRYNEGTCVGYGDESRCECTVRSMLIAPKLAH